MATAQQSHTLPESTLQVRRLFDASRGRIFGAWTEPERMANWMCRSPEYKTEYLELDVRSGGRYRIRNTSPAGDVYDIRGEYREVLPPEKLAFTWQWTKTCSPGSSPEELSETLVTVEFFQRGKQTEIVLTHSGFPTAEMRENHTQGWKLCFDTLERTL